MKIRYYRDSDTLYIEFRRAPVAQTQDFDEDTQIDMDALGNIQAITMEHASKRAGLPFVDFQTN